jgi:hypothetical protein
VPRKPGATRSSRRRPERADGRDGSREPQCADHAIEGAPRTPCGNAAFSLGEYDLRSLESLAEQKLGPTCEVAPGAVER